MTDETVTPLWTLTRVRQIENDTGNLSLTFDGETIPKVEVTPDGRTTFNTSLAVAGPMVMEGPAMAHSGLTVTGAASATGTIEAAQGLRGLGAVPVGAILMWSGDPAKLPAGWYLCNGGGWLANGDPIPDLRGSFIVGHDPGSDDYKAVQSKGGSATRVLKVANLPKDDILNLKQLVVSVPYIDGDNNALSRNVGRDVSLPSNGSAEPFDIRPPWYALAYIIYAGRGGYRPGDANVRGVLLNGEALKKGQSVVSPSGRYELRFETTGKLALFDMQDKASPRRLWVATSNGSEAVGATAFQQLDGNFVLYAAGGSPAFASNTYKAGVKLRVSDEGKVRIDNSEGQAVWSKP